MRLPTNAPAPNRLPLPANCSARVAFAASPQAAFVALLDGSIAAVALQQAPGGSGEELRLLYRNRDHATPVFSAPVVLHAAAGGGAEAWEQLLVVAHVEGRVRALRAASGAEVWSAHLRGQLFADLVAATAADELGAAAAGCGVVAATHAGKVYCLAAADGAQVRAGDKGMGQGDSTVEARGVHWSWQEQCADWFHAAPHHSPQLTALVRGPGGWPHLGSARCPGRWPAGCVLQRRRARRSAHRRRRVRHAGAGRLRPAAG